MTKQSGTSFFLEQLPAGSGRLVSTWLNEQQVDVRLSKPRQTKLGDFRPPYKKLPGRISVNSNLHPVEFLLTLAHELAHAENWQQNGRRAKPHGREWKAAFRNKLAQIIDAGILDEKFERAIENCFFRSEKMATSSCSELRLLYDMEKEGPGIVRLVDIPEGSRFKTTNGKIFIKGKKMRTRYRCREARTMRIYTVHPMTEIIEFRPPKLY